MQKSVLNAQDYLRRNFNHHCKKKGCYGIIIFVILPWWKCLSVIKDKWWLQRIVLKGKKCFSEQREAEPTATISPYVPIVLCAAVAYTNLELERKWRTLQVVKEKQVTVCETADAPVSFQSDVSEHFGFARVRKWERRQSDGQTKDNIDCQTNA